MYQAGKLNPEKKLMGVFAVDEHSSEIDAVMDEINAAFSERQERKARQQAANDSNDEG